MWHTTLRASTAFAAASRVLPPADPVEAVFKPPEALPHSYLVPSERRARGGGTNLAPPVSLRVPKALQHVRGEATGPATEELEDPAGMSTGAGSPSGTTRSLGVSGSRRHRKGAPGSCWPPRRMMSPCSVNTRRPPLGVAARMRPNSFAWPR